MTLKIQGSKMQVLLHMAAWAIILGLPLYFFYRWDVPRGFVWGFYINAIVNALIFYNNYLLLIPRLFMKGKRIRYFLAALGLAVGLYFISVIAGNLTFERWQNNNPGELERREAMENRDNHRPPARTKRLLRLPYGPMHIYNYTFNVLFFTIFPLGLRVLERHSQIEKRQKELEKEKLNSELAFLKNQISPHFFFNTLNNIYALIDINKEDSQNAVLKLSRMMRYLLYESEEGETRMSSEIEFMNNYIDLMKLRISEKVKLSVSFPAEYDDIAVPPLLFISIIENAFKHGISYREKSFIDIEMAVSKEMINFSCINSIVKNSDENRDSNSGIGLENLKKRLNLLFPDLHEFSINQTESSFHVLVKIWLTKT